MYRIPRRIRIVVGLVGAVVLAIPPSTRGQGSGVRTFTGATLIDGDGARIEKAMLVIRDGRVVSAGRSGAVPVPREARQIPLAGKFVIPGLITDAARVLKLDDIGTLKAGAWGDFVVLDRDPLQDIRNTRTISGVWIAGHAVKR